MKIINMNPIVFLFFFFFFSVSHSQSTNNSLLTQSQSLQDGQALISPSEIFVLGFVTIGDSQNRYLGMWYNKLPVRSVVWIANRDAPLNTTSGTLTIAPDGNLVLLDSPDGTPIWSTNVSVSNASASTALLMDNGNLILTAARNRNPDKAVWQSFEHPTDNYLPGMTVPLSPRGRRDFIRSWKSETDPSTGNFSLGLDPDAAQTVIWQHGDQKRWRSGLWNGQIFIGVPTMTANYLYGFQLTSVGGNTFFSYTVHNSTEIIRFRMRWDGVDEQLRWDAGSKDWTVFWSQPTRPCEFYNTCGAFGICNSAGTPVCDCFRGFEPRTPSEWGRGNWSAGCRRRESAALQCDTSANNTTTLEGEADWFHELDGLKLPDFAYMTPSDSRQHCSQLCSNNCSCKAYAYVNGIQCLTWSADLIDVQKFGEGGQKLFIRLAASEKLGKSNKRLKLIIILVVVLGTLCLCLSAYMIWRSKTKAGRSRTKGKKESEETKSREFWEQHDADGNQANGSELAMYTFQEIVTSTSNFSSANKLGEGGFGPVYKGKLPGGLDVAVKRLSRKSGQGLEEFKNEIILIAKLQHRNLVRLVGYCVEGEEKVLLYEYLPNRSLDAFIFANPRQHLDWHQRYNIIEGIARGLLYLHRDSRLRIIHRDLKASNILLDEEMNPKISDFGMAKIFGGNQNQANTNRVVGTYGYMAPEYAMEGLFSVKSDVYSFGVLLLEIISGKKNQYRHPEYSMKLIGYAWNLWGEERAMEFIDPSIRDTCSQASALRCINVGLLCVQDSAMDRPIMSTVVLMLESETPILPTPRQPTFTMGRSPMEMELVSMDSAEAEAEAVSRNFMTNTMVLGR